MSQRKWGILIAVIGLVIITGAAAIWFVSSNAANSTTQQTHHNNLPAYSTLLPDGKTINQLGGWQRVSPSASDPVYAYTDTIKGVGISVSQQPIPASFGANTSGKIAELAKSYNATHQFDVNGTTVYYGTSAKGPQSVIFTKNNLLVLIKSEDSISETAWKDYIASLS